MNRSYIVGLELNQEYGLTAGFWFCVFLTKESIPSPYCLIKSKPLDTLVLPNGGRTPNVSGLYVSETNLPSEVGTS